MITIQNLETLIESRCSNNVQYKSFNDICSFIRGVTFNSTNITDEENAIYKVLRANNIILETSTLSYEELKYLNDKTKVKAEHFLMSGDTLMCIGSGSKEHVGKVTFIEKDIDYVFGGFMASIRTKDENIIIPKFIFHLLSSSLFRTHLEDELRSTTINNINNNIMNSFMIPVPPIQVQQEIVKFLDNLSSNTNGLIGCLEEEIKLRKEIYKGYLDEKVNVNTNLSSIGSLVETINGYAFKASDFKDNGKYNVLQIGNVHTSGLSLDKLKTTNFEAADKFKVINDDILMALTGNVGRTSYVDSIDDTYYINQRVLILRKGKNIDHKYLNYSLLSSKFINNALDNATGAAQPNLSSKWVDNYQISVPTLQEQQEIVKYLDVLTESTNGLVKCLEEEIKLRKQEYEFYRNKVLTF